LHGRGRRRRLADHLRRGRGRHRPGPAPCRHEEQHGDRGESAHAAESIPTKIGEPGLGRGGRGAAGPAAPGATIRLMKRSTSGRNTGLTLRMLLTGSLLGLLYVVFAVILFSIFNVGLVPMLVIVIGLAFFQYFTSDKLALAASGAKVVSREDAPALHDMVERL